MHCILHIGIDKTGTTAIQHELYRQREQLAQQHRILVPQTGLGFDNGHARLLDSLNRDALTTLRTELAAAANSGMSRAVLCWEGMSRYRSSAIKRLLDALEGYPVTVLVYLREQAQVIQSGHLQWVQMQPGALSVASLMDPHGVKARVIQWLFLRHRQRNYWRMLKQWQGRHASMDFNLRLFETEQLVGGNVLADFFAQIGAFDLSEAHCRAGGSVQNPSLDVESALILQQYRNASHDHPIKAETMDENALVDTAYSIIHRDGQGSKYFFDRSSVEASRRHFRSSNRRLRREFAAFLPKDTPPELFRHSACWREMTLDQLHANTRTKTHQIVQMSRQPTLWQGASGNDLPKAVALVSGWSHMEPWGTWSTGRRSVLRTRLPFSIALGSNQEITVTLFGRYYANNSQTAVAINGMPHRYYDLSDSTTRIVIPRSSLGADLEVAIELLHDEPTTPLSWEEQADERPLAFGLQHIEVGLVQPGDNHRPQGMTDKEQV